MDHSKISKVITTTPNIPCTFSNRKMTTKSQRYQLHENQVYSEKVQLLLDLVTSPKNTRKDEKLSVYYIPYANNCLKIILKSTHHVLVKIKFWISTAVKLELYIKVHTVSEYVQGTYMEKNNENVRISKSKISSSAALTLMNPSLSAL